MSTSISTDKNKKGYNFVCREILIYRMSHFNFTIAML